jgi:hypothetical protein
VKSIIISLTCFSIGCGSAGEVNIFDQAPNQTPQDAAIDSSPSSHHPLLHLKLPSSQPYDASSNNDGCYFQRGSGLNCSQLQSDDNILGDIYYCCPILDAATIPTNFQGSDGGWDDGSTNDAGMKVKLDAGMKIENDAETEDASPPIETEASAIDASSVDEASNFDAADLTDVLLNEASFDDSFVATPCH